MQLPDHPAPHAVHATASHRMVLNRLGLLSTTGTPTARAAFWLPMAGAVLTSTGVALWLFS